MFCPASGKETQRATSDQSNENSLSMSTSMFKQTKLIFCEVIQKVLLNCDVFQTVENQEQCSGTLNEIVH